MFKSFLKDSSQAEALLEEFKETGLSKSLFAVELGNEIYGYDKLYGIKIKFDSSKVRNNWFKK